MRKSCKYCGRMHSVGHTCSAKPSRHKRETAAVLLRNSSAWAKKRAEVNERDHYLCRLCLAAGDITVYGLETHHIIPLEEDAAFALVDDWLITLCVEHHKAADRGEHDRAELHALVLEPVEYVPPRSAPADFPKCCNTTQHPPLTKNSGND